MALIPETGEGLANANSLVTLDEVRAFAASRGQLLPADDTVLEQQVLLAHDYLLAYEPQLQGYRRVEGQALPFPRSGLWLYGRSVADNIIPSLVKNAISQLVIEAQTADIMPSGDGRVVVQEVVGPISTTYGQTGAAVAQPVFPRVMVFLAPLFASGYFGRLTADRG